jgi:hypothetical protein
VLQTITVLVPPHPSPLEVSSLGICSTCHRAWLPESDEWASVRKELIVERITGTDWNRALNKNITDKNEWHKSSASFQVQLYFLLSLSVHPQ